MSDLQAVVSAYEQIDQCLREPLATELNVGDGAVSGSIDRERRMNGQAFFLLAWGQLEAEISAACRPCVSAR